MKRMNFFFALLMITKVCLSQDLVFDQSSRRINVPIANNGTQWEIGSSCLLVILQKDNQKADTIFNSIGCSQYHVEVTEEYTDLKIYLWPFYFYRTDCALEDDTRPDTKDGDLLIHYIFFNGLITVEVKWNVEKYTTDSVYSSIDFDSFNFEYLYSVFSLIRQGKSIQEIIDLLSIDNQKRQSNENEIMYRNDVMINLLPLNNKTFSSSDIYVLTECLNRIHKKYNR